MGNAGFISSAVPPNRSIHTPWAASRNQLQDQHALVGTVSGLRTQIIRAAGVCALPIFVTGVAKTQIVEAELETPNPTHRNQAHTPVQNQNKTRKCFVQRPQALNPRNPQS